MCGIISNGCALDWSEYIKSPYKPGDILYVRETWWIGSMGQYCYLANYELPELVKKQICKGFKCRPSIHMPKAATRIFLRVTNVRVERVQDITDTDAKAEGANFKNGQNVGWEEKMRRGATDRFAEIWDSTIKKKDIPLYGWDANPWVWVYEFERVMPEGES
jgi:hypothetical protein